MSSADTLSNGLTTAAPSSDNGSSSGSGGAVGIRIRDAKPDDAQRILELIQELAVYEKAPDAVTNTKEQLLRDGWGSHPRFFAFMAELDDDVSEKKKKPVGFALCFWAYSTWKGSCVYLEDLYVSESARGRGVGMALMKHVVSFASRHHSPRVMWVALDWNLNARRFYREKIGAKETADWIPIRMESEEIAAFMKRYDGKIENDQQ